MGNFYDLCVFDCRHPARLNWRTVCYLKGVLCLALGWATYLLSGSGCCSSCLLYIYMSATVQCHLSLYIRFS